MMLPSTTVALWRIRQVGHPILDHHGTIESPWKGAFPSSDGLRTTVDNILFQRGVQWLFRADRG